MAQALRSEGKRFIPADSSALQPHAGVAGHAVRGSALGRHVGWRDRHHEAHTARHVVPLRQAERG
jgi:hypothetical protein